MSCEHFVNLCFELISAALDLAPHQNVAKFNKRRGAKSSIYGMVMRLEMKLVRRTKKQFLCRGTVFVYDAHLFFNMSKTYIWNANSQS